MPVHTPTRLGVLQIEPTDLCDLSCAMCLPHRAPRAPGQGVHGIPSGRMDPALFTCILEDLARSDALFDHVILQWMGEPSLHPALPEMVAGAARLLGDRVGYLRIDTNGCSLTPDRVERLVAAWNPPTPTPLLVVFSVDAVQPATYQRVKGQDRLHQVRRHIRTLMDAREALPLTRAPIHLQVQLVLQEENAPEVGAFVDYWTRLFACRAHRGGGSRWHDEILVKRLHVAGGALGQARADRTYEEVVRSLGLTSRSGPPVSLVLWEERPWERDDGHPQAPRGPCPGPWMTPVVRWDGQLTACCADLEGRLALGSLARHTFVDLWWGPQARALRDAHRQRRFPGPCASCGGIGWYHLDERSAHQEPPLP